MKTTIDPDLKAALEDLYITLKKRYLEISMPPGVIFAVVVNPAFKSTALPDMQEITLAGDVLPIYTDWQIPYYQNAMTGHDCSDVWIVTVPQGYEVPPGMDVPESSVNGYHVLWSLALFLLLAERIALYILYRDQFIAFGAVCWILIVLSFMVKLGNSTFLRKNLRRKNREEQ